MSKKIIAGLGVVAGLAAALAPVATFATASYGINEQADQLRVFIPETCSFGYEAKSIAAGTHINGTETASGETGYTTYGAGAGIWTQADVNGGTTTSGEPATTTYTETLQGVMAISTKADNFGKTRLNIFCNDADGYTISAVGTNLIAATSANGTIDLSSTVAVANSAWGFTVAATDGFTNAGELKGAPAEGSYYAPTSATTIVGAKSTGTHTTPETGDSWTIQYAVSVDAAQASDVYTGHVTYTLASIDN